MTVITILLSTKQVLLLQKYIRVPYGDPLILFWIIINTIMYNTVIHDIPSKPPMYVLNFHPRPVCTLHIQYMSKLNVTLIYDSETV